VKTLRARLTLIFAVATALVLAVVWLAVVVFYSAGITQATDTGLRNRADVLRSFVEEGDPAAELVSESGERLLQIYAPNGRLLASSAPVGSVTLLSVDQVRAAFRMPFTFERERVTDGEEARVRAFSLGKGQFVAALGESLERDHALRLRLAIVLAIVLPAALVLATYLSYRVAGSALGSVERLRLKAASIDEPQAGERLPEVGTGDEIDRLGQTFNALLDRVAAAVEHERRMVADASHELRTPLSIMRAELQIASGPGQTEEQLRAAVGSALEETERLSRVADDMLILARLDQEQLVLGLEPLDVADVLAAVRRRNEPLLAATGRRVTTAVEIDGGAVMLADPLRIGQALDNLVANGLRHGAGTVSLVATQTDAGRVRITVDDEGDGVPDALLPHALERFSQGDPAHGGPGSGLGLAIVEGIVHAHGGSVSVANGPDGGARITVELPAA
jgi:signal transduction histidine kinase